MVAFLRSVSIQFLVPLSNRTPRSCPVKRAAVRQKALPFRSVTMNVGGTTVAGGGPVVAEEEFDLLDSKGALTGKRAPRSVVHRDGLWHRSTHIWVVSLSRQSVLLQKRSQGKDTFPGRWDVSAAGHVSAGGSSATTAKRELEEELGLVGNVRFLFTAQVEARGEARGVAFWDREFEDVYVYEGPEVDVEDVSVEEDEVDEVCYWKAEDVIEGLLARDERLVPRGDNYLEKFVPFLTDYLREGK